jgi:hypothetical protein
MEGVRTPCCCDGAGLLAGEGTGAEAAIAGVVGAWDVDCTGAGTSEASIVATASLSISYKSAPTAIVSSLQFERRRSMDESKVRIATLCPLCAAFDYLHCSKVLCDDTSHGCLDIYRHFVRFNQRYNIFFLDCLTYLYRPFHNCSLQCQ